MIKRVFNLLFSASGVWIAALIFNWSYFVGDIGLLSVLIIGAVPLAVVSLLYYIVGNYVDLF